MSGSPPTPEASPTQPHNPATDFPCIRRFILHRIREETHVHPGGDMPRNSMEYTSRGAEEDQGTEHRQEYTGWTKEAHAYAVLRNVYDQDRDMATEMVNVRSRVANNDYPAVSWMDQTEQGRNEPRDRIWEAYQQTREDHDPEQNEHAAQALTETLTHRAKHLIRDFIDPDLNHASSHNEGLDSAVKEAVQHQTMMQPWGVEETRLMEHLQEETARGLQEGNKERFEDALVQMHEIEDVWHFVKGDGWDKMQKENLEPGYAFLNRLGEKDLELLRELDGVSDQPGQTPQASWLDLQNPGSAQTLMEAFREATETFPIERTDHIARELASTMEYPAWKETRELANHHADPAEHPGGDPLARIPDREGFKEMTLLAAEDLSYGLRRYKDDLTGSNNLRF